MATLTTLPPAELAFLEGLNLNALLVTNYLSTAALVFTLYDHLLTLDEEIEVIWSGPFSLSKAIFLYMRYGTECLLLFVSYILLQNVRKPINTNICHGFVVVIVTFSMVFTVCVNSYMSIRHYALWDHGKGALYAIIAANIIIYIPALIVGALGAHAYIKAVIYVPFLDSCLLTSQPNFIKACWTLLVAFDVFAIALNVTNALHRPYRHQTEVLTNLRRDGAISFFVLFVMRLINMIINFVLDPTEVFLGTMPTLALISIIVSRFILRVEALRRPRRAFREWIPGRDSFELGRWASR